MKFIPLLIFLMTACTPAAWKAVEDGVNGEMNTAEQVAEDLGANVHQKPVVTIPVKKF
jgi:hypothetical protein